MSDFTKITLIIAVVLGIIALCFYAYLSTEKLDDQKETVVESNIEQHLNNDLEELYDNETAETEEDYEEGPPEDDDFEEYIEPEEEDWIEEDTILEKPPLAVESSSESEPFLLIAGSYRNQENASSKVKSIKKLGLSAEIVQFDDTEMHSVCIGRFETEDAAKLSRDNFKEKYKIRSYIHKKRN